MGGPVVMGGTCQTCGLPLAIDFVDGLLTIQCTRCHWSIRQPSQGVEQDNRYRRLSPTI